MLNGMRVRRLLPGRMILVEAKEAAFAIIEGSVAVRICAN